MTVTTVLWGTQTRSLTGACMGNGKRPSYYSGLRISHDCLSGSRQCIGLDGEGGGAGI